MLYFFQILIFVVGIACLVKGAGWLVDGASSLAQRSGLTPIFIGLTIVAMGTSTPELIVNLTAAFNGNTEIALGNILGSNIANVLLILGVCSVLVPLTVRDNTVWKEIPFGLLAVALLGLMGIDWLSSSRISLVSRLDGFILLFFLVVFLRYTVSISKDNNNAVAPTIKDYPQSKSLFLILAGLVCLFLGGRFVVSGAISFASMLGLSEAVIGLTIVAVGTSLPELVTSISAVNKGNNDIAIGNIVGSNILNVFFILGLTAVISPLPVPRVLMVDVLVAIISTLLLFGSMFFGKKLYVLDRKEGIIMLSSYLVYIIYLIYR